MSPEDAFPFEPEIGGADDAGAGACWKVLSVEDDPTYQASLVYGLKGLSVMERPVEVLTAGSAFQAARLIAANPSISVILLDVVMEEEDAGLRLVGTVREVLGNAAVRIVLLTGQPGMAPCNDVMARYDIDDYWCKTELTNDHLRTIVRSNIRTWEQLTQLIQARQGLQMMVDASRVLSRQRDLPAFSRSVLNAIESIIDAESGGILCTRRSPDAGVADACILAATGVFEDFGGRCLGEPCCSALSEIVYEAFAQRRHLFRDDCSVLYFFNEPDGCEYLSLVRLPRPLTTPEINLLRVFSENVSTGFANLSLYDQLTRLAYYDRLLDIPNRNWLLRELDGLGVSERKHYQLILLEIDDFTDIGVTFGELFCNALLRSLLARLRSALGDGIGIARIERQLFALLVPEAGAPAGEFFARLLAQPLQIEEGLHSIAATVAAVPLRSFEKMESSLILRLAESTVATARREQRRFVCFSPALEREVSSRYSLLSDLRHALSQQQLTIELQPKVRLADEALIGFEALVRWKLDGGRTMSPEHFIPLAERSGLVEALDRQVLDLVCAALKQLRRSGIEVPVAFNVAGSEIVRPDFFATLIERIQGAGVAPDWLELEITETQALKEYDRVAPSLQRLIDLGMKVSIDDFGTGYSSLAYLSELVATTLKIDRSFIRRLDVSAADEHLVQLILSLGECFGFSIVAEGVETESQRRKLLDLGCKYGQGFLFARPMPVTSVIDWVHGRAEVRP